MHIESRIRPRRPEEHVPEGCGKVWTGWSSLFIHVKKSPNIKSNAKDRPGPYSHDLNRSDIYSLFQVVSFYFFANPAAGQAGL